MFIRKGKVIMNKKLHRIIGKIKRNQKIKSLKRKLIDLGFKCDNSKENKKIYGELDLDLKLIKTLLIKTGRGTSESFDLKFKHYEYCCIRRENGDVTQNKLEIGENSLTFSCKKKGNNKAKGCIVSDINTLQVLYHSGDMDQTILIKESMDIYNQINSYYKEKFNVENLYDLFKMY
jgi:hypothetical protein